MKKNVNVNQLWIKLKDGFTEAMIVPDGLVIRSSGETSTGHGTEPMVHCPCKSFLAVKEWLHLNMWEGSGVDITTQEPTNFAEDILQT